MVVFEGGDRHVEPRSFAVGVVGIEETRGLMGSKTLSAVAPDVEDLGRVAEPAKVSGNLSRNE